MYAVARPRTQFFGIVAPGGWEGFFDDAGESWSAPALPAPTHPYDFSRMGPAMGKHGVMRVERDYCAPSNGDATDRDLPSAPASYSLQSGYGARSALDGHLATTLLDMVISKGALEMRTVEAGRGSSMPALKHEGTHLTLYVLNGSLRLALDGAVYDLHDGDFANIPAGTAYATEVISGNARWVYSAANGNGLGYWSAVGEPSLTYAFSVPMASPSALSSGRANGIDVALVA